MDDFVLLRFLWHFEALRQVNKKTTLKCDELGSDGTLPAIGDSHTMRDFQTIHHDEELKQDFGKKPHTKTINNLLFWLPKVRKT
ncbi:hypothetical protein ACFLV7_14460 [Chloroflexota bacterium]